MSVSNEGRLRRPAVQAMPFAAVAIAALVLDQLATKPARGGWAIAGLSLTCVCGAIMIARIVGWVDQRFYPVPSYLFLVAVVMLRHAGGGSSSGWSPLFLLPIVALATHASRRAAQVGVTFVAIALLGPIVLVGAPDYPASTLKSAVLIVSMAGLIETSVMGYRKIIERDQADLRATAAALQRAELRWRTVAEASVDATVEMAADGTVVDASPGIESIFGVGPDVAIGTNALDEVHPDDLDRVSRSLRSALSAPVALEFRLCHLDDVPQRWLEAVARPSVWDSTTVSIGLRNVTSRQQHLGRLERLARSDPLSGVLNRQGLQDAVSAMTDANTVFAIYIDLDQFKPINDSYGHSAGDEVLRVVANRLRLVTREGDHLARLGGDEFAIIGAGASRLSQQTDVIDRIKQAVAEPILLLDGHEIAIGASVGLATGGPLWTVDELLETADRNMYLDKQTRQAFQSAATSADLGSVLVN